MNATWCERRRRAVSRSKALRVAWKRYGDVAETGAATVAELRALLWPAG